MLITPLFLKVFRPSTLELAPNSATTSYEEQLEEFLTSESVDHLVPAGLCPLRFKAGELTLVMMTMLFQEVLSHPVI